MNKSIIPTGRKGTQPVYGSEYPRYKIMNGNVVYSPDNLESYITNGYLANSTVYAIVTQISKKFASIPLLVYTIKKDKKADFERYKCLKKDFNPQSLITMETLRKKSMDEVEGTELNDIIDNPAPGLSGIDLREQLMGFRLLNGAGSMRMLKDDNGKPLGELEVLPTQFLNIVPDGTLNGIERFELNITGNGIPINKEDVFYWKYWNPNYDSLGSHLYGLSPIKAGLKDIEANNAGKKAAMAMFQNGGARGILSANEADSLTQEQAIELRDRVNERINGSENKGKIVPVGVPVTWQQLGMSAVDMSLIEANKLSKVDICNLFGFPPVLITNENTTYNNVREAKKDLVTGLIVNECNSFSDALNRWLVPMYRDKQYHIDFDISALPELQDDMQKLADALSKMPYLNENEKRSVMKWDASEDPNMNKHYYPGSMVPLDQLNMAIGEPLTDELDKAGMNDYKR